MRAGAKAEYVKQYQRFCGTSRKGSLHVFERLTGKPEFIGSSIRNASDKRITRRRSTASRECRPGPSTENQLTSGRGGHSVFRAVLVTGSITMESDATMLRDSLVIVSMPRNPRPKAEYSLTESALSPFQAEPTQISFPSTLSE
jgi:hypothetical protein